jgi:hypothetical protein
MTRIFESGLQLPPTQPPVGGREYIDRVFTEATEPLRALEAQMTHAEGYLMMGFVTADAITTDGMTDVMRVQGRLGRLKPELDHARGPQMDYYTSTAVGNPEDNATLRKYRLKEGQTHEDLPAWQLSGSALNEGASEEIKRVTVPEQLLEISALARSPKAHPLTAHAVIRHAIRDSLGNGEYWFSTLVSSTHDALVPRYGAANLRVLGKDVTIDDPRVSPDLTLRPIVLEPDEFHNRLAEAYSTAETPVVRNRLGETLLFFSDGLEPDKLSTDVHAALRDIRLSNAK